MTSLWILDETKRRRTSDASNQFVPRIVHDAGLSAAIAEDRVDVTFQPIFSLPEGKVVAVEALARLDHATNADGLFLRASRSGLGERLSRQMQRKALHEVGRWSGPLGQMAVTLNVLPEDLGRMGYDDWLLQTIREEGVDPTRVTVEITEHAELVELPVVRERLDHLGGQGLRIALDDFGTGYASLASLAYLPLDTVKVDRSLIAEIEFNPRAHTVVRSVLDLARELGLDTIIEGVETVAQLDLLRQWGCTLYQGFLSARSMNARDLDRFVRDRA